MYLPVDSPGLTSKKILGVTGLYPTPGRPERGAFVHVLFSAFRRHGHIVTVLAPRSYADRLRAFRHRQQTVDVTAEAESILRPGYMTISTGILPFPNLSSRLTYHSYRNALQRGFPRHTAFDFVYAHFFASGWACIDRCEENQIGCIVGLGESNLAAIEQVFGPELFVRTLQRFTGIVAASRDNEAFCRDRCPSLGDRLMYLPNGVDLDSFVRMDQQAARHTLGLPAQSKIIIFCGHLIERKGPFRVLDAIKRLDDVYGVFLGQGPQVPDDPKVLHVGPVPHGELPLWMSAADIFVLPSLAEGMSNAILEALACGLPVVVSDRSFNRSFLSDKCAVFVNPLSAEEIASAVDSILSDGSRWSAMSQAATLHAGQFSIMQRADRLVAFASQFRTNS